MGDNMQSDLLAPSRAAQWKTVAIINELDEELKNLGSSEYSTILRSLLLVEQLIASGTAHAHRSPDVDKELRLLKEERMRLRVVIKTMFNRRFGSVFRTYTHRSFFFFTLGSHCDLYTANINNFLNYPLNECFYAQRYFFPHESAALFKNGNSLPQFPVPTKPVDYKDLEVCVMCDRLLM